MLCHFASYSFSYNKDAGISKRQAAFAKAQEKDALELVKRLRNRSPSPHGDALSRMIVRGGPGPGPDGGRGPSGPPGLTA